MKILISMAQAVRAEDLRQLLEAEGNECIITSESKKTIDDVYLNTPDMIMLDAGLRFPNVQDAITKLKSAPSTRDIPILIVATSKARAKVADCYSLGAYDYISYPFFREEIIARMTNIGYVSQKMREIERMLVRDYLTGLYNRKFFMERFDEELAWASRYGEPLSLIILDIDHFKKINDTYGHSCGDEVLKQMADSLTSMLRAHDVLARYGGEEFVVLLSNTSSEEAMIIAEKLRAGVNSKGFHCCTVEQELPVTISLGISCNDGSCHMNETDMINRADEALYQAKASGRNRAILASSAEQMAPQ